MVSTKQPETIMLIDGFGLIFRAYHAIDASMKTAKGEQTNAVFGFARMLLDVLNLQKPTYAIVALEGGRTFRHDSFEEYKANRAEAPEDLVAQIGRVKELIEALNIPIRIKEGYEADDVIGSLAQHCATERGLRALIVTGDSDLLQLVQPNVDVVLPGRPRFQDLRLFDRERVIERYGFAPEFIPDYKALVGDTSDNIPGVPGIGEKTATALIQKFGDAEQILTHVDEVSPPRAKNALEGNVERFRASKTLATIVRDLDVDCDLEHSRVDNFDRERVVELFRELEFRSLLNKLPESKAPSSAVQAALPVAPAEPVDRSRQAIRTKAELATFVSRLQTAPRYAIDVETNSLDPINADLAGIAIALSPVDAVYIALDHAGGSELSLADAREALNPVLGDPARQAIAHHAKYDLHVLNRHGFTVGNLAFDTMIAAYLLGENAIGLKDLSFTKLGIEMTEITELIGKGSSQLTMNMVPVEQVTEYACGDVESTIGLADYFAPILAAQEQRPLFGEIEIPLISVLLDMEATGVAIDSDYLTSLAGELRGRMRELEKSIYALAGHDLNINSTKQLATLLFEELGLSSGRKTKTGLSVDADVLEAIRNDHPIVEQILEYKSLGKLQSTYIESLPKQVNPRTGRIHTSYNQTIAATGRLSSTNPNLQNIPIRTELGRRVRQAFVADHRPDHRLFDNAVLLSADYSQIELRLMAHMSGEPFLVDAFRAGQDIHAATAALVYGVEASEVTSDQRRVAKTVNFGLLYGMQAFGLARDTGLSRSDAQKFIDMYWSRLPNVRRFFDETLQFGQSHGYVRTLNNRRRLIPDLNSTNGARRMGAERMAINMPVQGTAADIMKVAMIHLHNKLVEAKLPARIILQVHDELVLEADSSATAEVAKLVRETMSGAASLSVPLEVDVAAGQNWEEMEELAP